MATTTKFFVDGTVLRGVGQYATISDLPSATNLDDDVIAWVVAADAFYRVENGAWIGPSSIGGGGVGDHGGLTGLADDDHTQYHTDARADTWWAGNAATQAEAEAGSETGLRAFSPLRIAQAISALGSGGSTSTMTVYNDSGAAIPAKRLVRSMDTLTSGTLNVRLADKDNTAVTNVLGMTTAEIANGAEGTIQITGEITYDTSSLDEGPAWLGDDGQVTNEYSGTYPNSPFQVGYILDNSASGTVRLTLPATVITPDGDLVGTLASQSLENKVLSSNSEVGSLRWQAETLDPSGSITITFNDDVWKRTTLTGTATFSFASFPASGKYSEVLLEITQDGTGGRTASWPTVEWLQGEEPDLANAAANEVVYVSLWSFDGGTTVYGQHNKLSAVNAQTGTTYTYVLTDAEKHVTHDNASAITATIPTNASVAYPVGTWISVQQLGAGQLTVEGDTGVTVNGSSGGSVALTNAQYETTAVLIKHATNTWTVSGAVV